MILSSQPGTDMSNMSWITIEGLQYVHLGHHHGVGLSPVKVLVDEMEEVEHVVGGGRVFKSSEVSSIKVTTDMWHQPVFNKCLVCFAQEIGATNQSNLVLRQWWVLFTDCCLVLPHPLSWVLSRL